MMVINDSGAKFGFFVGCVPPRSLSATMVVKATFALKSGAVAEIVPEDGQADLDGETPWPEDPEGGIRSASDFAPFKPGADLLLAGCAHASDGRPATQIEVSFSVEGWSKSLLLVGDRFWKPRLFGTVVSDPLPFTRMPITWSRSYGGPGFKKNPLGRGTGETALPDGTKVKMAPNVMDPRQPVHSPDAKAEPAGFCPVDPGWPQRMRKVGTYGRDWLKNRWPWFPDDFDWSYFNAAPEDQQLPGTYLKGDERLSFRNLHPHVPHYEGRLPGLRMRWFVHVRRNNDQVFREVPLVLDTLFADLEQERLTLTWRGVTEAYTYKLKELEEHFILREPLQSPLAGGLEAYRRLFLKRKEEILDAAEVVPVPYEPLVIPPPAVPDLGWVEPLEKEIQAMMAGVSFDPATQPGWAGSPAASRVTLPPPPLPAAAPTLEQAAEMARRDWATMRAADPHFAKGIGNPPDFAELIAAEKEIDEAVPPEAAAPPPAEAEEAPPWTRDRVVEHAAGGGHFEKEDLSGLDLSGLDLRKKRFCEALLHGTILSQARLDEADFTNANLGEADLTGASLSGCVLNETDLTEAKGPEADFSGSTLDRADFSDAKLPKARFVHTRGRMASFAGCDLSESVFDQARLEQPDFSAALIAGARFVRASLPDAGFYEAQGPDADFSEAEMPRARCSQADFTKARFPKLRAPESIWDESLLGHANFQGAEIPVSNFGEALIEAADFTLASLPQAKLENCRAKGAQFVKANLFRATFEGADLSGARLYGANLFEAEFFRTVTQGTDFQGANLKRTKLA